VRLAGGAEIDLLGIGLTDVAHDLAVLAEEQPAVGIQHHALGLERTRREPVVAVRNHVGVVHVDEVLAVQHRVHADAIEEELSHPFFFLTDRGARLGEVSVPQHRLGEAHHVEDDVELFLLGPGVDVLGIVEIHREDRRRDAEVEGMLLLQRLHGANRFAGLLEAVLHRPHLVVHLADAVDRYPGAEDDAALFAELDDFREHRNGPVRGEAGGVQPELAQARESGRA
jgi:hypothetical protein